MLLDILIVLVGARAVYRGRRSGFLRQLLAAVGFLGGLFFGGWLLPHTIGLVQSTEARAVVAVFTTLGFALVGLSLAEYLAIRLKRRLANKSLNSLDTVMGGVMAVATLLVSIWLLSSMAGRLPSGSAQTLIRDSRIVTELNRVMPSAPRVIAGLSHLIDPNGFPDVFIGNEPIPRGTDNLPSLGDLQSALNSTRDSVVRIKGQGCGGVVSGSGFVVGKDFVATNAHVVAGIGTPFIQDANGSRSAQVVWFDPNLDFAVLKTKNLAGSKLTIATESASRGTQAAVLGYPSGGDFSAGPAAVINRFRASGRDIYGQGRTVREVYSVQAKIVQGNSGGPLIDRNGKVIGMIFAESTKYNRVGYAFTSSEIIKALKQAEANNKPVSSGRCAA